MRIFNFSDYLSLPLAPSLSDCIHWCFHRRCPSFADRTNTDRRIFRSIDSGTIHKGASNNIVSTAHFIAFMNFFGRFQLFERLVYCLNCLCVSTRAIFFVMHIYQLFEKWKIYERVCSQYLRNERQRPK